MAKRLVNESKKPPTPRVTQKRKNTSNNKRSNR